MRTIPCTIEVHRDHSADCWVIQVPEYSLKDAAEWFSELLSGSRKRVVFLDHKTDFTVTADSATFNNRQVPITRTWLECLEKLFSARHTNHIDYDFSDRHGDVTITVFVKSFLIPNS